MSEVAVFRAQGGMQKLLVGFGNGEVFGPGLAWLDWDVISGAERLRDVLVRIETAEYGDSTAPAATTAKRLVYRLLALAVGESAIRDAPVQAVWGDSLMQSQGDFFPEFPGAYAHIQKRFEESHHQAFLLEPQVPDAGHAVEWTWGLVRDGRVLALLDGGGWMHDALGAHRNLVTTYAACHDLRATYAKHLAPML